MLASKPKQIRILMIVCGWKYISWKCFLNFHWKYFLCLRNSIPNGITLQRIIFAFIWISNRCFKWLFDWIKFLWQYRQFWIFQTRRKTLQFNSWYWQYGCHTESLSNFLINEKLIEFWNWHHFQFNRRDFNWFHSLDSYCREHYFELATRHQNESALKWQVLRQFHEQFFFSKKAKILMKMTQQKCPTLKR